MIDESPALKNDTESSELSRGQCFYDGEETSAEPLI